MEEIEILKTYESTGSMKATAKELMIDLHLVRRVLITHGAFESKVSEEVAERYEQGESIDDIAKKLHISRSWVISNLPYTKGSYKIGEKSKNALAIAKSREKSRENR